MRTIQKYSKAKRKVYFAWHAMRQRCLNKDHPYFYLYGGRGITVCKRWESFENFMSDMGIPPNKKRMSLDRKDNNKGYFPKNCRWATPRQQTLNSRNVHWLTWNGETYCIKDWARKLGVTDGALYHSARTLKLTIEQIIIKRLEKRFLRLAKAGD